MSETINCKNCGAPLDGSGKCPYCGSVYRVEAGQACRPMVVEVHSFPVKVLGCEVRIDRRCHPEVCHFADNQAIPGELVGDDGVVELTLERMRHQLADGLMGMIKVTSHMEPGSEIQVIRGTVRVVPPDFRF